MKRKSSNIQHEVCAFRKGETDVKKVKLDGVKLGLDWILQSSGITIQQFFQDYWEKKPLLISRKDKNYYGEGKPI